MWRKLCFVSHELVRPSLVDMEGHNRKKVIVITFKMAAPLCQCYQVSALDVLC